MKKSLQHLVLLILVLTVSSWAEGKNIKGSGKMLKEQREVTYFEGIKVSNAIHVYLREGDKESIEVEGDDNIIPFIKTEVKDRKLYLTLEGKTGDMTNFQPNLPMNIYVTIKKLREIDASSASKVTGQSTFNIDKLELEVTAAANVKLQVSGKSIEMEVSSAAKASLKGSISDFKAELSGAAKLDGSDLQCLKAYFDLSGASSAVINVIDELQYDVSGASKLVYEGTPRIFKAEVSGAGKVQQKK